MGVFVRDCGGTAVDGFDTISIFKFQDELQFRPGKHQEPNVLQDECGASCRKTATGYAWVLHADPVDALPVGPNDAE